MKRPSFLRAAMTLCLLAGDALTGFGQASATNRSLTYALLEGSELIDDCPVCARPTIVVPMRGTFRLSVLEENPLFSRFAIEGISFLADSSGGRQYQVTGSGTYRFGGEVALVQEMFLQVQIDDGISNKLCFFTNVTSSVSRLWPMVQVALAQTNGTLLQTYELTLKAAPSREIWFSTLSGFHAGIWQSPTNSVSPGDLISSVGRVVKRNQDLTRNLGIMPLSPDVGLDAVDVLPGGEIAFSMEQDIFSETLGPLHHGDILSATGRVLRSYTDLIGVFGPQPLVAEEGLDALQVLDGGEIYFSIVNDFFSERLSRTIRRGDLLSSLGRVVKTNEELLARFNPSGPKQDYGLDGLYVWPSGEIWFSTEQAFSGPHSEFYGPGDLLSDQGYMVYANLELLGAFQPVEDVSNFGLDALFVVTDTVPLVPAARITRIAAQRTSGSISLEWQGVGQVFQVERATKLLGPYVPRSPIGPDRLFEDVGALGNQPQSFYRVRQW